MDKELTAVIQAGGMGTRLEEITKNKIPKPLVSMNGKPMLEWQLTMLMESGIRNFIFIIGHLGDKIQEFFGDGTQWGVRIEYVKEPEPLGSAGALYILKDKISTRDFLLIFGDIIFDLDFSRMIAFHLEKKSVATLLVHPNSHPYDSDLVVLDKDDRVTGFDSKKNIRNYWYENCVNAGIFILNGRILNKLNEPKKMDLEQDLIVPLIKSNEIFGYRTTEYVKDAGTVDRFYSVERELALGIGKDKNLRNKQKCVFLDRDGTINRYKGLIHSEEDFELEDNAAEAVRLINESGYLAIVLTNQPVVARGLCNVEDVETIHKKMISLLGMEGAYLDDIIFCPHHPDRGYLGENPAYKIECNCRKPKTGMIDVMINKYNIDRNKSYIIGDTTGDILTGINSGIRTVLVQTGEAGSDGKYIVSADMETIDVLEAVKSILDSRGDSKR